MDLNNRKIIHPPPVYKYTRWNTSPDPFSVCAPLPWLLLRADWSKRQYQKLRIAIVRFPCKTTTIIIIVSFWLLKQINKLSSCFAKKGNTIQYAYKKCGTHVRVFPQTLVHGTSKNETRPTEKGKMRGVSMKRSKARHEKNKPRRPNYSSGLPFPLVATPRSSGRII